MAKKVVVAGACRTAIGKMGGALANVPATELGAIVIREALARAGVPATEVDHVYMGCVIQAGLGQNVARQASIKAGLPVETPAVTVNVVCGSGLNCVNMAAQMIQAGDADIVVAGGMENMSMAPYAMMNGRFGYRMNNGRMTNRLFHFLPGIKVYRAAETDELVISHHQIDRHQIIAWVQTKRVRKAASVHYLFLICSQRCARVKHLTYVVHIPFFDAVLTYFFQIHQIQSAIQIRRSRFDPQCFFHHRFSGSAVHSRQIGAAHLRIP